MESNSLVAIMILAFGGLASASFYAPLKLVKWKWEIMWTFYAIFALLVVPNVVAPIVMPSCWEAIGQTEGKTLFLTFLFGALWGIGGLTFGLSMRYLGIGLGTVMFNAKVINQYRSGIGHGEVASLQFVPEQ